MVRNFTAAAISMPSRILALAPDASALARCPLVVAAVLAVLAVANPTAAGPLEDGLAAFARGEYATAVPLLTAVAEQGNALAQVTLGEAYMNGQGVPQDDAAAIRWYRMAAEQRRPEAQTMLGLFYGAARGVPQDFVLACMWLNLAAAQGHEFAADIRDSLTPHMTPEQISEAQRLAAAWRPAPH